MAAVQGGYPRQQPFSIPVGVAVLDSPKVTALTMSLQERPSSALARGIQITEFKDNRVNPEPIPVEESEILLEEYLSPRKLRALTGVEDLHEVHYLEMKVDTRDTSLGNFGTHLPSLSQLKLSNSIINCIRDLGSSLNALRVLWMARCGLEDLDGVSSMNNLKELYLAYNDIVDISPCSLLENLATLDLEGNNIDDISQVNFLNSCSCLRNLTLEGNPVCVTPSPDEASLDYDYRQSVKEAIPHLRMLDDEPLTQTSSSEAKKTASVFDDDWALIDELLQDGTMLSSEENLDATASDFGQIRPVTAIRPVTGSRPITSSRSYTGTGIRPGTRAGSRPGTGATRLRTAARPITSRPVTSRDKLGSRGSNRPESGERRPGSGVSDEFDSTEDASDLTRGRVVCGNPSKALLARNKPNVTQHRMAAKMLAEVKLKAESKSLTSTEENSPEMGQLLSELKEWRESHAEKQKIIDESKAPQVLTINYDNAVSLSDDESVTSDDNMDNEASAAASDADDEEEMRQSRHIPSYTDKKLSSGRSNSKSRSRHHYDETFDAPEDSNPVSPDESASSRLYSPHSRGLRPVIGPESRKSPPELRPLSNPVNRNKGKFRLEPFVDKNQPKVIDPLNPIVRASVHSPESRRLPDGPRADTANAALTSPSSLPPPRIRKGLHNVQLLPSKFTK